MRSSEGHPLERPSQVIAAAAIAVVGPPQRQLRVAAEILQLLADYSEFAFQPDQGLDYATKIELLHRPACIKLVPRRPFGP
jgi:hypothetical protein